MEEKEHLDILREQQNTTNTELKVISLAKVKNINDQGYRVELIPKLNNKTITVQTINKLYERYFMMYWAHNGANAPDIPKDGAVIKILNGEKNNNAGFYIHHDVKIGDVIAVGFLDSQTTNFSSKSNLNDTKTKHNYGNCVALVRIYNHFPVNAYPMGDESTVNLIKVKQKNEEAVDTVSE